MYINIHINIFWHMRSLVAKHAMSDSLKNRQIVRLDAIVFRTGCDVYVYTYMVKAKMMPI